MFTRASQHCARVCFAFAWLLLLFALPSHPVLSAVSVLQNRYDRFNTAANLQETQLTTANVNRQLFGKLWTYAVDGDVHAQPLYVANLNFGNGVVKNVLYVVTMQDCVYAFDADAPGAPIWQRDFRNPASGVIPMPIMDLIHRNSSNIETWLGILPTPVIDSDTNTIYVLAVTREPGTHPFPGGARGNQYVQRLHALDIKTGVNKFGSPVVIAPCFAGNGTGSVNGVVCFDGRLQLPRPAMTLVNGQVVLAWSGQNDWGGFHGWIVSYDKLTLAQTGVLNTSPDSLKCGVWMSGRAPGVDAQGNLYFQTGNGDDFDTVPNGGRTFAQAVIKLQTNPPGLRVLDWWSQDDYAFKSNIDADFGSTGPLLVPGTAEPMLLVGSKDAVLYLLDARDLGHKVNTSHALQQIRLNAGNDKGGTAYWDRAGGKLPLLYSWPEGAYLQVCGCSSTFRDGHSLCASTESIMQQNSFTHLWDHAVSCFSSFWPS
eukprot:TRINITY_DN3496_c0_g1_i2.p1 TRINITY_DN3496_c0_g1~~TRINITY_DN3496_c0_g1_i2.p1  ORF type:complete len:484 (-),score=121.41 TRINITY_DN3496_c0_g1_i2:274-1725(-)